MTNPHDQSGFDAAFARLQGADPAMHVDADVVRLRSKVDDRIAATPVDELAQRRPSRRWVAGAAAVLAGAVIIGSGGFALGNVASGARISGQSESFGTAKYAPVSGISTDKNSALGAAPKAAAPAYTSVGSSVDAGPTHSRFVATISLSVSQTTMAAYTFAAAKVDAKSKVIALARAVGITTSPTFDSTTSSYVASGRSSGVAVAQGSLVAFRYSRASHLLTTSPVCLADGVRPVTTQPAHPRVIALQPSRCDTTSLSKTAAASPLRVAQHFMSSVGVTPADFTWSASGTPQSALVRAVPAINGVAVVAPTASWLFAVSNGSTVMDASGSFAPLTSLGRYSLVSAKAAVSRLNDPGFSAPHAPVGSPLAGSATTNVTPMSPSGLPTINTNGAMRPAGGVPMTVTASPGAKFVWPIRQVSITKSALELSEYRQPDGTEVLLPTYVLTASDGHSYRVIAVSDKSLITAVP